MHDLQARPFALIGVNRSGVDSKTLAQVMAAEQLPWRSFADHGAIARQWNTPGTPTFYVIDHQGVIRHKWRGSPGAKAIDDALDPLIRAAAAAGERRVK